MKSNARESIHAVLEALQNEAVQIRTLEAEAREALFTQDDKEIYTRKLKEKTMKLMELPDTLEPLLENLDAGARNEIQSGLENFSGRAGRAWGLSSLFYMSALLYPDDYVGGDKNDLERFIDRLKKRFSA
jgi:hypothetical protein